MMMTQGDDHRQVRSRTCCTWSSVSGGRHFVGTATYEWPPSFKIDRAGAWWCAGPCAMPPDSFRAGTETWGRGCRS